MLLKPGDTLLWRTANVCVRVSQMSQSQKADILGGHALRMKVRALMGDMLHMYSREQNERIAGGSDSGQ